ncbi:MAG TPA: hypothetical protein VGK01_11895 [Candidatus Angelobacter sp.]|jgi:hypothetical protein
MSNEKKQWYITENTDAHRALADGGIFHVWGGITGLPSATHPESIKYLLCVDWAGRGLQERLEFEKHEHVTALPHTRSRKSVHPKAMLMLKECTANSGDHAITDDDHTHDIVEKLTGHTGWHGWFPHL